MFNFASFCDHFWALRTKHAATERMFEVKPGQTWTDQGLRFGRDV